MGRFNEIAVRKNGGKVHRSITGSSTCDCGYWMRTQTSKYRVKGKVKEKELCQKCFPGVSSPDLLEVILDIEIV